MQTEHGMIKALAMSVVPMSTSYRAWLSLYVQKMMIVSFTIEIMAHCRNLKVERFFFVHMDYVSTAEINILKGCDLEAISVYHDKYA